MLSSSSNSAVKDIFKNPVVWLIKGSVEWVLDGLIIVWLMLSGVPGTWASADVGMSCPQQGA